MRATFLIAACVFLTSCAFVRGSENEPIDPAAVRSLVPGQTTAREVTERLGAPSSIVELGNRSAYRYDHLVTKGAGLLAILVIVANADSRADRLWVFFDENDVLTHYGATLSGHRGQYAFPWEDVHEQEDNDAKDAERPGLTK